MASRNARALWTAALSSGKLTRKNAAKTPTATRGFRGVILGVDPSLRGTGLAIVDTRGNEPKLLASETLTMHASVPTHICLARIYEAALRLASTYEAKAMALESTIYVQNLRTVHILGASRGASLAAAGMLGLEVAEYAPTRIKLAVTGNGKASKEQVGGMVRTALRLSEDLPLDESDAAAAALCHGWSSR
ncbi:MAG TPA: crossover junction endodeoxyribonuclease RuvC [Opitutae bacterium]|nr:crossover junction endodeoxyribonuclease RuvC [Opitutae bacterium]